MARATKHCANLDFSRVVESSRFLKNVLILDLELVLHLVYVPMLCVVSPTKP
jgi:hypothetical protein